MKQSFLDPELFTCHHVSVNREACERDELRTPCSPEGLGIVQVTADPDRDSHAVYLDTPSWTPDSKRFVFNREASADGAKKAGLWMCDTVDGFSVRPIVEYGPRDSMDAPASGSGEASYGALLSPDGTCAYHLVRRSDRVELRSVDLDTLKQEPVCIAPLPIRARGANTMSADSERLCMGIFLGDGTTEGAPWGAYVFDVRKGTHRTIEFGNGYRNMHCQYSHDPNPAFSHDISLIGGPGKLSDGSWLTPPDGSWRHQNMPPPFPPERRHRGEHQVVRDDGTTWRMLPLGNGRDIISGGHNTWRGRHYSIVGSMYHHPPGRWRAPLFEVSPIPVRTDEDRWLGQDMPGAKVVDLTRKLARADSCHFGFDGSGKHFVSDTDGYAIAPYSFVFVGTYVKPPGEDPFVKTRYLLLPRTSWKTQPGHPHPYLSPDGRYAVIQSDFSGRPQVHIAFDFEYP